MSEVAAVGKGKAEESIADIRHCHESGRVCLGTRVRLNINVIRALEDFLCA